MFGAMDKALIGVWLRRICISEHVFGNPHGLYYYYSKEDNAMLRKLAVEVSLGCAPGEQVLYPTVTRWPRENPELTTFHPENDYPDPL